MMTNRFPVLTTFFLYLSALGASGQFAKIATVFHSYEVIYHQSGVLLGLVLSMISLIGAVLGLMTGVFVTRIGFKTLLTGALLSGAVLSALEVLLPPLPVFLTFRLLEGLSHLCLVIAVPTMMAQIASDRYRPLSMTLFSTFFGTAFVIFGIIASQMGQNISPRPFLAMHAIWMALCGLSLILLLPKDVPSTAPFPAMHWRLIVKRHIDTFSDPHLSAAGWGWLFYTLTYISVLTLLPKLARDGTQLLILVPLIGIVLPLCVSTPLLSRMPAVRLIMCGFVLAASICCLAFFMPSHNGVWIALFAALTLIQAGSFAAVPQLNNSLEARALANGAMTQMGNLGNLLGTPILLGLIALGDTSLALTGILACYLAGFFAHLLIARKRRAAIQIH